jgi:hypothetical protein
MGSMRVVAYMLNVGLLACAFFLIAENGIPRLDERDFVLFFLVIFAPLSALISLFKAGASDSDGLISLYFKRKALEEQKKIDELTAKKTS